MSVLSRFVLRSRSFLLAAGLAALTTGLPADGETPGALTMGDCPTGAGGTRLQLVVDTIRSNKGNITVVVYGDKPSDFLAKGKKLVKVHLPVHPGTVRGCVLLPKPGTYALAAYHDEDNDHHLTRSVIGMPEEGYAFSNNPGSLLGLPAFSKVKFATQGAVTPMPLHIHYP